MKFRRGIASAILVLCASPALAHPMGNFSVNRYARLEPSGEGVSVLYIVDFAEIPTVQSISRYPSFAADPSAAALNASPDREALCRDLAGAWQAGLSLRSGTGSLALRRRSSSLVFSPGAGGLPTMKLRLELETSSPDGLVSGTLSYEDDNAPERIGWREVVVRPGAGVALSGDAPTLDRSRELTAYPADPDADIPQAVTTRFGISLETAAARSSSSRLRPGGPLANPSRPSAAVRFPSGSRRPARGPKGPGRAGTSLADSSPPDPGSAPSSEGPGGVTAARAPAEPAGRPTIPTRSGTDVARAEDLRGVAAGRTPIGPSEPPSPRPDPSRSDRLADLVSRQRLTPGIVVLSLLIAACLGGLHALSPGHGKTVVAAYLVGSRGTARHALLLGLVVTASHTIGVFLLGLVTLALSKAIVPEKLYPAIQFLSGLTIVVIGATLFARRLGRRIPEDHGHSHEADVPPDAPTASALLALGVSGGILPCPSALVVLLSAIALHRVGFGLVLIVAFSAGLASVLSGIGILVVRAGRFLGRFESAGTWARKLPAFSALLIGALGFVIAARALAEVRKAFF